MATFFSGHFSIQLGITWNCTRSLFSSFQRSLKARWVACVKSFDLKGIKRHEEKQNSNTQRRKPANFSISSTSDKWSKNIYYWLDITYGCNFPIVPLKILSSSLSCVSECSRAQPILPSLNTLGFSQWQTYLKGGRCGLIKYGGFLMKGATRSTLT